jgi:hypothetical protein
MNTAGANNNEPIIEYAKKKIKIKETGMSLASYKRYNK